MTIRDESKRDYSIDGIRASREEINVGSFQRIADACELMAKNHRELISERDRYQQMCRANDEANDRLWRRISALKGAITRLRRKGKG